MKECDDSCNFLIGNAQSHIEQFGLTLKDARSISGQGRMKTKGETWHNRAC